MSKERDGRLVSAPAQVSAELGVPPLSQSPVPPELRLPLIPSCRVAF